MCFVDVAVVFAVVCLRGRRRCHCLSTVSPSLPSCVYVVAAVFILIIFKHTYIYIYTNNITGLSGCEGDDYDDEMMRLMIMFIMK